MEYSSHNLNKEENAIMHLYKAHCKPIDPNHPTRIIYEEANRKFINALRRAMFDYKCCWFAALADKVKFTPDNCITSLIKSNV